MVAGVNLMVPKIANLLIIFILPLTYVVSLFIITFYGLFILRKPRSSLRMNGEAGFLRVSKLWHSGIRLL